MMDGCNTNGDIIRTYIIDDYSDNLAFSCSTGTMWHIPSGTTLGVCPNHQYFIYGDMLIEGELQLSGNSQLVVLNGNINLSGGTITGTGNAYNIFLPLTDTKISGLTYDGSVLTIYQTDGTNFSANIAFTGNTSGSCITNLYVQNLNSCSPLHIQPINNGDVYISESGGNVGIGTTNPLSTLDVNGKITTTNFQMTSGSTYGYVLTSDVSGNAYWAPPFSGASVDTYVTGFTYDSSNNLTISQNQGQPDLTVTLPPYITGFTDYYVTGGTYTNGTLTLERQDSSFTISGFLTGTTDTYVTGFTYLNNNLTISQNEGQPDLVVNIDVMSGLTINGSLSATTYQNLPIDVRVTGGTFNTNTDTITFTNNIGGTFDVTGITDYYVTGGTFNTDNDTLTLNRNGLSDVLITGFTDYYVTGFTYSNNTFSIKDNSGSTFSATINSVTGWTVNGNLTVNGTTTLSGVTNQIGNFNITGTTNQIGSTTQIGNVLLTGNTNQLGYLYIVSATTGCTLSVTGTTCFTGPVNITGPTFMSGNVCMNNVNSGGVPTGTNCLDTTLIPSGSTVLHQFQGSSGVLAHIGDLSSGEPNSRGYTYFENNIGNTSFTATSVPTVVVGPPQTFNPYNNFFSATTGNTIATTNKLTYTYIAATGTSYTYLKYTVSLSVKNANSQVLTFNLRQKRGLTTTFLPIGMSIDPNGSGSYPISFNGIAQALFGDEFEVFVTNSKNPPSSVLITDFSFSMFT